VVSFSPSKAAKSIMISVTVNGTPYRFDRPVTLAELLQQMALAGKRIAVEKNGDIVPRSTFDNAALNDGDRLEIVVAVGGG